MRVSIIEGRIPWKAVGYTLHLGADTQGLRRRADAEARLPEAVLPGRFHRTEIAPNSPHLPRFKAAFQRHRQYFLIPFSSSNCRPDGVLTPRFDLAIKKTALQFKSSLRLKPSEPEFIVLDQA